MRAAQNLESWWRIIFLPNQEAPLPLQPGKEALDEPTTLIASQLTAILSLQLPRGPMRGDHVDAVPLEIVIDPLTVIRAITTEMLGLGFEHGEIETELDQRDLMMIRRMRTHEEEQSMPIHHRQNLHALATFGEPDSLAAALGSRTRRVNEALALIYRPFFTERIRQLGENLAQHLVFHHC